MPILGADLPVIFYDEAQFSRADLLGSGLAVYFSDFGLAASRTAVTSATMAGDRTRHAPGRATWRSPAAWALSYRPPTPPTGCATCWAPFRSRRWTAPRSASPWT